MESSDEHGPASVFAGGAIASLLLLTALGAAVGFDLEPLLEGHHSLFTYVHYVFVVGGLGGVVAIGWAKTARLASFATSVVVVWVVVTSSPRSFESAVQLTSELGVVSVAGAFAVPLEYGIRNPDNVRSALTPQAVRTGLVTGTAHAGLVITARGLLGFYEGGFLSTILANPGSAVVAVWSIGGLFVVGFVAGVLARRYKLLSPLVSTGLLFAAATVRTWLRVHPDGPSGAIALHAITLYSWAWLGTLAIGVGFAFLEREMLPAGTPTSHL